MNALIKLSGNKNDNFFLFEHYLCIAKLMFINFIFIHNQVNNKYNAQIKNLSTIY